MHEVRDEDAREVDGKARNKGRYERLAEREFGNEHESGAEILRGKMAVREREEAQRGRRLADVRRTCITPISSAEEMKSQWNAFNNADVIEEDDERRK